MKIKNLRHECGKVVWDVEDTQEHNKMYFTPDELELVLKSAAEFAPFIVEARKHRVDKLRERMRTAESDLEEDRKRLREEEQALNGGEIPPVVLELKDMCLKDMCWKCHKVLNNVTTGIVQVGNSDAQRVVLVCGICAEKMKKQGWEEIARAK